jgi:hypothetical protein
MKHKELGTRRENGQAKKPSRNSQTLASMWDPLACQRSENPVAGSHPESLASKLLPSPAGKTPGHGT